LTLVDVLSRQVGDTRDPPEVGIAERVPWVVEVRRIGEIKRFRSKLRFPSLRNRELAE